MITMTISKHSSHNMWPVPDKVSYTFDKETLPEIKSKMLDWLKPFGIFTYLDNNGYGNAPNRFELLVGAGQRGAPSATVPETDGDWWMGHIAYDYKNVLEPALGTALADRCGRDVADCFFYRPEVVAYIPYGETVLHLSCYNGNAAQRLAELLELPFAPPDKPSTHDAFSWSYLFTKTEYVDAIERLKAHIEEGDCYEINFCTGAYADGLTIDPFHIFEKLNALSPAPFSALYKNGDDWLLCASPERFLYKKDKFLLSQPIKGTARRGKDAEEDERARQELLGSEKERAENVMIVDLVRNDLARTCVPGSVAVPELFGLYAFPQVHQLISTVTGTMRPEATLAEAIKNAFPMGSMTGAPKYMVMQLIDRYERQRRGLFSGAVGYIDPQGDFDFNVVIRSLQYNERLRCLLYQTGGAITYDSDPEQEWEETRIKAMAMERLFRT